jgi:hypothetical protein
VQSKWRYCPHCTTPLSLPQVERSADLERDVRKDTRGSGIGLAILIALVVIGAIYFFVHDGMGLVSASEQGPAVLLFAVVIIGGVLAGVALLHRTSHDGTSRTIGTILGGLAIGVTVVLSLLLLVLYALCAGILGTFRLPRC